MTKQCSKCNLLLSLSSFYLATSKSEKLRAACKQCHYKDHQTRIKINPEKRREYLRKWRRKNPERSRQVQQKNRDKNPIRTVWHNLKSRMKLDKGGDINSCTFSVMLQLPCTYCGIHWDPIINKGSYWLDRINNDEGYTWNNTLASCGSCNKTRGDRYSVEETKIIIKALLKYRKDLAGLKSYD